jgi:hypothetical protein
MGALPKDTFIKAIKDVFGVEKESREGVDK